jgi:hypothetical protein
VILVSLVLFAAGVLACLYVPSVEEGLSRLIFADTFDARLESGGS